MYEEFMKYFSENDTLFDIIDKYPETIPVFVTNGFSQMENTEKLEKFAKSISLKMALMLKKLDINTFSNLLTEAIKNNLSENKPVS